VVAGRATDFEDARFPHLCCFQSPSNAEAAITAGCPAGWLIAG
jgi:hypothetical protein